MVVRDMRCVAGQHPQAAGHPQVQQQRAGLELEQEIFGTPPGMQDPMAGDSLREVILHAPAQSGLVHIERHDASADCVRLDASSCGLYFGKLGHGEPGSVRLRAT